MTEFRADRGIAAPIETVDWTGAYRRIPESKAPGLPQKAVFTG